MLQWTNVWWTKVIEMLLLPIDHFLWQRDFIRITVQWANDDTDVIQIFFRRGRCYVERRCVLIWGHLGRIFFQLKIIVSNCAEVLCR
jgi:hypothetical protein